MATIKEVSELAGVSSATVSRVINDAAKVKEKTRKQVMAAMDKLGYRHNVIAASLASNKTNTVGYVVPELYGLFFGPMMGGSENVLRKANKHMFVVTGHSDEAKEKEEIEALLSRRCDALILHVEAVSDDYLIELARQDVPIVVVNRYIEQIKDKCISLDNMYGGYLATKALVEAGHKDIAYISGAMFKADAQERLKGHKQALAEAGLPYNPSLTYEGNFEAQSGEAGITTLLQAGASFTAVACANDEMASGAIYALREHGKSVPENVSVIGFDNIEFASYLTPKLTTIDYPVKLMGQAAAKRILNQVYSIETEQYEDRIRPKLVMRESVAERRDPDN